MPTPSNKNLWFDTNETCKLCESVGTLNHILSGREVALARGRYQWRHDQVLREVAQCIEERQKSNNNKPMANRRGTEFVKEEEAKNSTGQSRKWPVPTKSAG